MCPGSGPGIWVTQPRKKKMAMGDARVCAWGNAGGGGVALSLETQFRHLVNG